MAGFGFQSLFLLCLVMHGRTDRGLTGAVAANEGARERWEWPWNRGKEVAAETGILLPAETGVLPPGYPEGDFMMVSSPTQKKVFWTKLSHMKSDGEIYELINSGLMEPKGLAFDHKRGLLYVADSGAGTIFRYTILVTKSGSALQISHVRLPVAEDCGPVEYVTLDDAGNLFYSSPKTNNINKIPWEVLVKLTSGQFQSKDLRVVSQKTMETAETKQNLTAADEGVIATAPTGTAADGWAAAQAAAGAVKTVGDHVDKWGDHFNKWGDHVKNWAGLSGEPQVEVPETEPNILSIYEAAVNPHVSMPGAIMADGEDLYWTNTQDGVNAGTVVKGQVNPHVVAKDSTVSDNTPGPVAFPAEALSSMSSGASGIAKTAGMLFFVRNGEKKIPGQKVPKIVTALLLSTGDTVNMVQNLQDPRAMVWDGDATIYVADETDDRVFSFSASRFMADAPVTEAVHVKGAYGVAILNNADPCFTSNTAGEGGVLITANYEDFEKPAFLEVSAETAPAAPASLLVDHSRRERLRSAGFFPAASDASSTPASFLAVRSRRDLLRSAGFPVASDVSSTPASILDVHSRRELLKSAGFPVKQEA